MFVVVITLSIFFFTVIVLLYLASDVVQHGYGMIPLNNVKCEDSKVGFPCRTFRCPRGTWYYIKTSIRPRQE